MALNIFISLQVLLLARCMRYSDVIFADWSIIKWSTEQLMLSALIAGVCSLSYLRFSPGGVAISGHSSEHKSASSNHPKGLRVDLAISLA